MNLPSITGQPVPIQVLQKLFWLRNIAITGQLLTVLLVHFGLKVHLPLGPIFGVIAFAALINGLTHRRTLKPTPSNELEVSLHLALDACLLALVLFYSGGFTNPFVSLFFLHIAFAASFLGLPYSFAIVLLTILLYTLLVMFYWPLIPKPGHFIDVFDLHLTGMWVNFILSALLMAAFVTILSRIARSREEKLARAREKMLQNEHLVLLGTLSAGVAHEINTPLSSINMLLAEMEQSPPDDPWVQKQIPILRKQTAICIERIRELTNSTTTNPDDVADSRPLGEFAASVLRRWASMRPEIALQTSAVDKPGFPVRSPLALSQVIINLLNNAADASLDNQHDKIAIAFTSADNQLQITIDDYGKGFSEQQVDQAGKLIYSTKEHGMGVGLVLSHATLEMLDGNLILQARKDGTRAIVTIKPAQGLHEYE
ncbi:MAG: HAMP domain-containing histidine kinase, partial [Gammaproteobacteria bacterium]|nr:HAMP domain-containing histidine kinase [Gammaproteobacteria bacterium]